MGPMFPRLNVNDTEKGGPRAPPRNKMALYEQLSIPSQRFKPNLIPSQGNGHERGLFLPLQLPSSRNLSENLNARSSDSNTPLAQFESRKRALGDDSRVCIFANSSDPENYIDRLDKSCINLQPENMDDSQVGSINDENMKDFQSEEHMFTINMVSDTEYLQNKAYKSLQRGNVGRGEDTSETSMVDHVSGEDDDIVGLIGKNRFWKARRSILHQQRVFALQVFELHRLIKVQKLIAGSPNLLLEGSGYLEKILKESSAKRIPLDCVVNEPQNVANHKSDSEMPNYTMEFSAESTVGKLPFSPLQNGSQPPSSAADQQWCFHQPSDQQWLIPVISPSEGLVYKPYPVPGFMNPVCGGCGPRPGLTSVKGQFPIPASSQHHYQGTGIPFLPPSFNGYFPPYGMPAMNSCNVPSQKKGRVIRAVPRNARSATEFAARIFQSIQEERNQYD